MNYIKLFFLLCGFLISANTFSQVTIGTEDFEAATPNWILNTTDLSCTNSGNNEFLIGNNYTGGTVFFGLVTIPNTPAQPAPITGSPNSKYLHIYCPTYGLTNANYLAGGSDQYFAKMNYDWNTSGKSGVFLDFYWLGNGGNGKLYYSTNSGSTWTQVASGYQNQASWTMATVTNSAFDNQATLRFGFMFQEPGNDTDPPLCVDQLVLKYPATSAPVADFTANSTTICAGDCINFTDLTANSPTAWSWSFNGASTTSSTNQNPTNVCYPSAGTYEVSLTATNGSGSDIETKTAYITVNALSTPTFSFNTSYCVGASPAALPGTSNNGIGGTWSPSSISTSASGTTNYVFTPSAGQCATSVSIPVTVGSSINPTFSISTNYCQGDIAPALPTISNNGISGSWAPSSINTSSVGTMNYVFTPTAGQCAALYNMSISINTNTTPTFTLSTTYCSGGIADPLSPISDNGITGSWTPSSISTVNSGITTYTFTPDAGQCATSITIDITIESNAAPLFSFDLNYCTGEVADILPIVSDNGFGGSWSPSSINTSSSGTDDYTFTPSVGQCATVASYNVEVLQSIVPIFTLEDEFCQFSTPASLYTTSENGLTGFWTPDAIQTAVVSTGDTYTFTASSGQCVSNFILTTTIHASPSVTAGEDITIMLGQSIPLHASAGASYLWSPSESLSCIDCQAPICSPTETTLYSLTLTDANGCSGTDELLVTVMSDCGTFFTPNAFSPNGDGYNDDFNISGDCIILCEMTIFNRWGNIVFQSSDPNVRWDGTYNGELASIGVYYYKYKIEYFDGTKKVGSSSLTLFR